MSFVEIHARLQHPERLRQPGQPATVVPNFGAPYFGETIGRYANRIADAPQAANVPVALDRRT
jgi:galactose mutarotase-like enzyme